MNFKVHVRPPSGPEFEAKVDEDNNWCIPGEKDNELACLLADFARLEILKNGIPAQPDCRSAYANAVVAALPGSYVISEPPESTEVDDPNIVY